MAGAFGPNICTAPGKAATAGWGNAGTPANPALGILAASSLCLGMTKGSLVELPEPGMH